MSVRKTQKGFTLIEVSLAIVIGVIVLAGAITLYNQTKVSAGNSKASERTLAAGSMIEELAAQLGNGYPSVDVFQNAWKARRDDYLSNPWGGAAIAANPITPMFIAAGTAMNYASPYTDWKAGLPWLASPWAAANTTAASAGQIVYAYGVGQSGVVADMNTGAAGKSFFGYYVGIISPTAFAGPSFLVGGK